MMQMIVGTIKNAVKLDMLNQSWEQKKNSGNVLLKNERNTFANMTPEQRMIKQFEEELARNREQSRNNDIANKIMNGEDLTPEEEQYLARNNPAQLSNYRQMQAEKQAYAEKLRACKTKDEVQRLKSNTMNAYLAELKSAPGAAKTAKAMEIISKVRVIEKAELKFIRSGAYDRLPTEADEAIERAEEKSEESAENLKLLMEFAEDDAVEKEETEDDNSDNKYSATANNSDDKTAEEAIKEIEEICKRYIPDIDNKKENTFEAPVQKPKEIKTGSKFDKQI